MGFTKPRFYTERLIRKVIWKAIPTSRLHKQMSTPSETPEIRKKKKRWNFETGFRYHKFNGSYGSFKIN